MNSTITKILLKTVLLLAATFSQAETIDTIKAQGGTGFTINSIRNFSFDENTIYKEDGNTILQTRAQGGTGFKVRYRIGDDVNPIVTTGTVSELDLINTHKGPVISLNPLQVFNVDMLITSDTYFDGTILSDISLGDELKISGFVDVNSSLLVSRLEMPETELSEWKISGYVSNKTQTHFNIKNQLIEISGSIENCLMGLIDGEFVEVKATPNINFIDGSTLTEVTQIECVSEDISTSSNGLIPVAVEGFVGSEDVALNARFYMAGQAFVLSGLTDYENGEVEDVIVGSKLEVEGVLDTITSEISVNKVKFNEIRFRFESPVMPEDVVLSETISLFGQIISGTPQLDDEDGVLLNGLTEETQVEVRGFADVAGNLFATRIKDKGSPNIDSVRVEGKVTAVAEPLFEVFGAVVDTSSSLLIDINGEEVSQAIFFSQLSVGVEVEIEEATLSFVTDVVSGGSIVIDEEDDDDSDDIDEPTGKVNGISQALGVGTVTSLPDSIFNNSFE